MRIIEIDLPIDQIVAGLSLLCSATLWERQGHAQAAADLRRLAGRGVRPDEVEFREGKTPRFAARN